jgi:hypothetical protein
LKNSDFFHKIIPSLKYKTYQDAICIFRIHPRTKQDVGYRLSRSGLAIAYGQQVEFQGPIVQNVAYATGSSTVNITYTSVSSIELRDPNGFEVYIFLLYSIQIVVYLFQVCCDKSICSDYVPWSLSTISGKSGLTITIEVNSTCVGKQLYGLRYLWRITPCPFKQAAIYSGTDPNLPSPPYIKLF